MMLLAESLRIRAQIGSSTLDIRVLHIGPEIDTGVPWTQSLHGEPLALALKSGNFGGDDFFSKAFALLTG